MVGTAVAVARGALPLSLLQVSLSAPTRAALPLAPPSSLVLLDAQFSPFRKSWDGVTQAAAMSGDELRLREQGAAVRAAFTSQVRRLGL
jgi:tRNA U38,U39,U40 pseudouridine synthase TruA